MRAVQGILRTDDADIAQLAGSKKCIGRVKSLEGSLSFLTDNIDAIGDRVSARDDAVPIRHLCGDRRIRPRARTTATENKGEDRHGRRVELRIKN